jgi:hypothetical protein
LLLSIVDALTISLSDLVLAFYDFFLCFLSLQILSVLSLLEDELVERFTNSKGEYMISSR